MVNFIYRFLWALASHAKASNQRIKLININMVGRWFIVCGKSIDSAYWVRYWMLIISDMWLRYAELVHPHSPSADHIMCIIWYRANWICISHSVYTEIIISIRNNFCTHDKGESLLFRRAPFLIAPKLISYCLTTTFASLRTVWHFHLLLRQILLIVFVRTTE